MAATAPDTIISLKSKDKVAVSDTDTVIVTETKTVMGLINTDIYFLLSFYSKASSVLTESQWCWDSLSILLSSLMRNKVTDHC